MGIWRYEPKYGPDSDDAKYAFVYDSKGEMVGNLKFHHAVNICNSMNLVEARETNDIRSKADMANDALQARIYNESL